jgi:hypothetical protein
MIAQNVNELLASLQDSAQVLDGRVAIAEEDGVRRHAERLAFNAVFG